MENTNITFNDVAHGSSFSDWFASQLSSFTPINVAIALVAALVAGRLTRKEKSTTLSAEDTEN